MSKAVKDKNAKLQKISIRLVFWKPKKISLGSS